MTSSIERDKVIPLRTSFEDESLPVKKQKKQKTVKENGIYPHHESGLDSDDRKSQTGKEHKRKREKKGEDSTGEQGIKDKKEKSRLEPEANPQTQHASSPYLCPPQRKSFDDGGSCDELELRHGNEKCGGSVLTAPRGSNHACQPNSESPSNEQRRTFSQKEPKQDRRWDESSDIIMIRAAIRRDFHDDGHEPDSKRCRCGRGNTSSFNGKKEERPLRERDKHSREPCRRSDFLRDACTVTKDSLFAPCQFLFGQKKESFKDLRESRECGGGKYERKNGRESGKCYGNEYDERNSQDLRRKNTTMFNRQSVTSTARSENAEGRGDDWKSTSQRSSKDTPANEVTQLKSDLASLQTELDRLKDCLKAAVIAAEKNKCTITKMREHFRCNFPCYLLDCARMREKLKKCNLMKMRLCGEFKVDRNQDCWRRDFECLKYELNAIKCELEKIRRDKR